jgi:hypothetical protein
MGSLCPALKIQAFERREKEREREKRREREREKRLLFVTQKRVFLQYDAKVKSRIFQKEREKKKKKSRKA